MIAFQCRKESWQTYQDSTYYIERLSFQCRKESWGVKGRDTASSASRAHTRPPSPALLCWLLRCSHALVFTSRCISRPVWSGRSWRACGSNRAGDTTWREHERAVLPQLLEAKDHVGHCCRYKLVQNLFYKFCQSLTNFQQNLIEFSKRTKLISLERRRKKKGKERGETEGRATPSHYHSKPKWERLLGFECILSWCSARNSR